MIIKLLKIAFILYSKYIYRQTDMLSTSSWYVLGFG